jgi:hypothetical protein
MITFKGERYCPSCTSYTLTHFGPAGGDYDPDEDVILTGPRAKRQPRMA